MSHVFAEIANERKAQDEKWGGAKHDDRLTLAEWVSFLTRHTGLAVNDGTGPAEDRFRKQMIRVAALAVAAVESIDRSKPLLGKTYAPREGDEGRAEKKEPPVAPANVTLPKVGVTTDSADPGLREIRPDGMQAKYLVLSEEERQKGFIRPLRTTYRHKLCGTDTRCGHSIAETYARQPSFYSGTYCAHCAQHFPLVDANGVRQFHWTDGGAGVGE